MPLPTVIHCGVLFDGTGRAPQSAATVFVEDGRISAQPRAGQTDMIDLSDCFVMPGFVDCHSHISVRLGLGDQFSQMRQPAGQQALRIPENLRLDLEAGTTTLRVMGEEYWLDAYAKQAVSEGVLSGPNLLIATRGFAPANKHGHALSSFDGVDEIRRGARKNFYHGADFLKVFATGGITSGTNLFQSSYTGQEMRALVEEAVTAETYVAAHAHGGPGLQIAAKSGARTIEHASFASEDDIQCMLDQGCYLVATFSVVFSEKGIEAGYADNRQVLENLKAVRDSVSAAMSRALKSGLTFGLGTDSMHGFMPYEIKTAIRLGIRPEDALMAATRRGAEVLGIQDRTGALEVGMSADLIGIEGNPLVDPDALDRVVFVMKDGITYKRRSNMHQSTEDSRTAPSVLARSSTRSDKTSASLEFEGPLT